MSKTTSENLLAVSILASAIVAVVSFEYSNIVNVPLPIAFESLKFAFCGFIVMYILLWMLSHSANNLIKALIPAGIFGAMPILEFHWVAIVEYATFYEIGSILLAVYILLFCND